MELEYTDREIEILIEFGEVRETEWDFDDEETILMTKLYTELRLRKKRAATGDDEKE